MKVLDGYFGRQEKVTHRGEKNHIPDDLPRQIEEYIPFSSK